LERGQTFSVYSVLVDISLVEHSEVKDLKRESENLAFGAMDGNENAIRTRGERLGICRVWGLAFSCTLPLAKSVEWLDWNWKRNRCSMDRHKDT
jgi:hypothetical protein